MGDNFRDMMGDNSSDTMGGNSTDPMDISGGEETETEYFHEVANFEDNLDQSIENLHGGLRLPIFGLDQSTGLQGSQGFQLSAFQNDPRMSSSSTSDEFKTEYVTEASNTCNQQTVLQGFNASSSFHPAFRSDSQMATYSVFNIPISNVSNTNNDNSFLNQGKFNVMGVSEKPVVNETSVFGGGMTYTFSSDKLGPMIQAKTAETGERSVDSADKANISDSQDPSGRIKTSPKGKGRKSRASSSISSEVIPKPEAQGSGVARVESVEPGSGEETFKPSLLDEILTDKKLALMRSPQVIRFLQTRQEILAREKALVTRQPMDS